MVKKHDEHETLLMIHVWGAIYVGIWLASHALRQFSLNTFRPFSLFCFCFLIFKDYDLSSRIALIRLEKKKKESL